MNRGKKILQLLESHKNFENDKRMDFQGSVLTPESCKNASSGSGMDCQGFGLIPENCSASSLVTALQVQEYDFPFQQPEPLGSNVEGDLCQYDINNAIIQQPEPLCGNVEGDLCQYDINNAIILMVTNEDMYGHSSLPSIETKITENIIVDDQSHSCSNIIESEASILTTEDNVANAPERPLSPIIEIINMPEADSTDESDRSYRPSHSDHDDSNCSGSDDRHVALSSPTESHRNPTNSSEALPDQEMLDNGLNIESSRRKRRRKVADPESWTRNIRAKNRRFGQSYVSQQGKIMPEKKPIFIDCTKCRYKCSSKISQEQQVKIHAEYWNLGDYQLQKAFLVSMVNEVPTARHRPRVENSDRRIIKEKSRIYSLQNEVGELQRICLKFFCKTLSISFRVIDLALSQKGQGGAYTGSDRRKGRAAPNASSVESVNKVKEHIDSFPKLESHYCRRESKKLYLSSDLNISIMYRLYCNEFCPRMNIIRKVSMAVHRTIFKAFDPALSFYKPKKDQCSKCNVYYNALDKSDLEAEWKQHKEREKEAMDSKKNDKELCKSAKGRNFRSISFDLQSVLNVPHAAESQIYYRRKMSVYNFCIYDYFNSDGYCYLWDEINGRKDSVEIGTSLLKYIWSLPTYVNHLTTFSDTCGGQNRNQFITAAMLYAVQKSEHLQIIDLKYMESGHSYLEADAMHSTIERARKHKKVYSTREWALLITMARQKPQPYIVHTYEFNEFYDLPQLSKTIMLNTKYNTDGQRVQWLKIKMMRFEKRKPNIVQYKYSLSEEAFMEFDISTTLSIKTRKKEATMSWTKHEFRWESLNLKKIYSKKIPISEAKKKIYCFY